MGAEPQEKELTDVVLCYQSMGIPLDASPAAIDNTFKTLAEGYKKKLSSADPAQREEAKASLEVMSEAYDKICTSITYLAMAKEHGKKAAAQAAAASSKAAARPVHKVVAEKRQMINCPRCNGLILKEAKLCPICKGEILTLPQQLARTLLTPKKIVLCLVLLALVAAAVLGVTRPDLFPGLKKAQRTEAAPPVPAQ